MTDSQIQTIILLTILATCMCILLYLIGILRRAHRLGTIIDEVCLNQQHILNIEENQKVILNRLSNVAERERTLKQILIEFHQEYRYDFDGILRDRTKSDMTLRSMKQALLDDGKLTRERIAEVKTRLADEERDDQKQKTQERNRKHHGKA